jgi:hypothetical protein
MTPGEVAGFARAQYNAVGDTFFSDAELYSLVWMAQNELAREANVIEQTYSTTAVASQQAYSYPSLTIKIKRVTYDGYALQPITFREDDILTAGDAATTQTGSPMYYAVFDNVIYLRPTPDAANALVIFGYSEAQEVSALSTLEVPTHFHQNLADFLLWRMAIKDKNYTGAEYFHQTWKETVKLAKAWSKKRLRGDSNAHVVPEPGDFP